MRQGVRQGVERLRAAKEQAKEATQGRCGDALAAASAVSGGRLGVPQHIANPEELCTFPTQ